MKRVVVTGVGPVSSIGIGKEGFWANAQDGNGHFKNVDFPDVDMELYRSKVCSPIESFDLHQYLESPRRLRRAARAAQFTVLGTVLAFQDAGFRVAGIADGPNSSEISGIDPERAGIILGQSMDNPDTSFSAHTHHVEHRGPRRLNPMSLPQSNSNAGAALAAQWFGLQGSNMTIATACSSATHAIAVAFLSIQNGIEELVVTGGADAPIHPFVMSGFDILQALSTRNDDPAGSSRPFDRDRDGFVLGEGAGILVLEELEHARKRKAPIYAEIIGTGMTADAHNLVAPDPTGRSAIRAIQKALEMGRTSAQEVEYINAHGTATLLNDPNESYVIKRVFGDYAYRVPISSSKSYLGHTLGAAGGLEAIVTLLAMDNGVIPPTSNLDHPDVEYADPATPDLDKRCDLDYVPKQKRKQPVRIALSESFGFGGQNSVLLFRKLQDR